MSGEFRARIKAHTAGKSFHRRPIARDSVGLLFCFDLQPVFGLTQKAVSPVEIKNFVARNELETAQRLERPERAWFLQKSMPSAVDKLQSLDDELDFANTAAAEFDVPLQIFRGVLLDPALDSRNLIQQIRRRAARVDKRLMLTQEFVRELETAGNPARFD